MMDEKVNVMNERIQELAEQTGLCDADGDFFGGKISQYEEFVELIRADEREACAKVCEEDESGRDSGGYYAEIIRARSER